MSLVESLAQAIATMEGFYTAGSRPNRNNNPGDLISWGSTPTSGGFAVFATPQDGWNALYSQIQTNINRGLTLNEFFAGQRDSQGNVVPGGYPGYAPGGSAGNNPQQYASYVGAQVGIDPNTPLNGASPGNPTHPRPGHPSRGVSI